MHILIVRNNSNSQALDASLLLVAYLNSQGLTYTLLDSTELSLGNEAHLLETITTPVHMAIVLGGDGTILRTARVAHALGASVLGINFGRLGFLANASDEGVVAIVAAALAGDVVCEHRTNVRIDVACEGDDLDLFERRMLEEEPLFSHDLRVEDEEEDGEEPEDERRSFFALNELALTRGDKGRIIDFNLNIAGVPIADMRGDGVVVATATGSTAYALSAGGPLVAPAFEGLVVVPLAPHTLRSRALVTEKNDIVEIDLADNPSTREVALFADGELLEFARRPVRLCVRKNADPTKLLRYKGENFYQYASQVFF